MKKALEIWRESKPNQALLGHYLGFMGIEPEEYKDVGLRLHPGLRCEVTKSKLPAMVACVINPANHLVAIHYTCIGDSWKTYTQITDAEGPSVGSSVRLFPTGEGVSSLIVATGICTALAARQMLFKKHGVLVPCWATLDAKTMQYLVVPEHLEKIVIAVDNDVDYASQSAGYQLAHKLKQQASRRVVSVWTPDKMASNFNDQLRHVDNG